MDPVGICNLALAEIDPDLSIQSLEEETVIGEACNLRFAEVRDELLSDGAWRWATGRHELAADATAPVYGAARRFPLPAETLQVLEVSDGDQPLTDWAKEGRFILTDQASPIYVKTVDQVDDVMLWPPEFRRLMKFALAALLCPLLSENRARTAELIALAEDAWKKALITDGRQAAPRSYTDNTTETVRSWRR